MSEAAKLRSQRLKEKIGPVFAKLSRTALERKMDAPPRRNGNAPSNGNRRSIYTERERIEACGLRQSFCWPICMEYMVLTIGVLGLTREQALQEGLRLGEDQGEDTFILDERGQAEPLSQTHIANILGIKRQNVFHTLTGMKARKALVVLPLDVEGKPTKEKLALVPNPLELNESERKVVIQTDYNFDLPEGPALPQADLDLLRSIADPVIRLDYYNRLCAVQTDYLKRRKVIQTERDKARKVIHEQALVLIPVEKPQKQQSKQADDGGDASLLPAEEVPACPTTPSPEKPEPSLEATPLDGLRQYVSQPLTAKSLNSLDGRIVLRIGDYPREVFIAAVKERAEKGKIGAGLLFGPDGLADEFCEMVLRKRRERAAAADDAERSQREADERAIAEARRMLGDPNASPRDRELASEILKDVERRRGRGSGA